jgi:hypothetical protein
MAVKSRPPRDCDRRAPRRCSPPPPAPPGGRCWAVGGYGRPSRSGSGIWAQSPTAQTPGRPGTRRHGSTTRAPLRARAAGRPATSGCGRLPAVQASVRVGRVADQRHVGDQTPGGEPVQPLRGAHPAEAAADDHDARRPGGLVARPPRQQRPRQPRRQPVVSGEQTLPGLDSTDSADTCARPPVFDRAPRRPGTATAVERATRAARRRRPASNRIRRHRPFSASSAGFVEVRRRGVDHYEPAEARPGGRRANPEARCRGAVRTRHVGVRAGDPI